MNERDARQTPDPPAEFAKRIGAAASRKLEAQRSPERGLWPGLGTIGLIGWSVVVPTLLGTALGTWADQHHPGRHPWTLALMVGGLSLGCLNAWRWISREDEAIHDRGANDRA